MDSFGHFITYIALKFVAYSLWCGIAGVWLARPERPWLRTGLQFGFVRLLIGAAAGVTIFLIGGASHWEPWSNLLLQYLAVYFPVRWLEWGIIEWLLVRSDRNPFLVILLGASNRARAWRLGGIIVSHLADIPIILSEGGARGMLPIGRFLC